MARKDANLILRDWRTESKGKGRSDIEWSVTVDIPGLKGTLDARELGNIMAAEMVDGMRKNLRRGRTAGGGSPRIRYTEKMQNGRAIKLSLIEGAPLTGRFRNLTKWVGEALSGNEFQDIKVMGVTVKASQQRKDWIDTRARLIQQYTATTRFGTINGLKPPPRTDRYLPNPDNKHPVDDSGMMTDRLSARYIPTRRGTNKETGKREVRKSTITFSTVKKRQLPLHHIGGLGKMKADAFIDRNPGDFKHTRNTWNNAVIWNEKGARMTLMITALRITGRILRAAGGF